MANIALTFRGLGFFLLVPGAAGSCFAMYSSSGRLTLLLSLSSVALSEFSNLHPGRVTTKLLHTMQSAEVSQRYGDTDSIRACAHMHSALPP